MDDVDRQLLNTLRVNARATYAELARSVGLSAPAVHERVAKLESNGTISGYHASVSAESLGYGINAIIGVFISDTADTDAVAAQLARLPEVEHCWFVAGEETFVIKVHAVDVAGLEKVIRRLNAINGIARTRTTVVLSTKFEDRISGAAQDE